METAKWTDIWQAWASVGTAIFTALSVVFVFVYTVITNRALGIALRTHEESLRPVIVLVKVMGAGGTRVATFRNAGGGLAIGLKLLIEGHNVMGDNNVLAPDETLDYVIPTQLDQGVLDLSYAAITKKPLRTISYFLADGRAFNDYLPDAENLGEDKIRGYYGAIKKYALSAQAIKLATLP